MTGASRVIPAAVKVARVVEASPKKRPPLIVREVPPVEGPKLGLQKVRNGETCGEGWNAMLMVAEPSAFLRSPSPGRSPDPQPSNRGPSSPSRPS